MTISWSYYGPPLQNYNMTDCKWTGKEENWYGSGMFDDKLSRFATALMGFMTTSMNESDHWALYENLYTGDSIESMLSLGRKNAMYQNFYSILLCLCLLPILIFIVAIWGKKAPPRTMNQIVYIWPSQIPLFAVTLFIGFCFTMSLWASHSTIQSDNNAHFAIGKIKNLEEQQLWMGQCELDNLENKLFDLKKNINGLDNYSGDGCSTDLITTDHESLKEAEHQVILLKNQLRDSMTLETLPLLDREELNHTLSTLSVHESKLWRLDEALTEIEKTVTISLNQTLAKGNRFKKESRELINSYKVSIDTTFANFTKVKESLDGAVKKLAQFATTVAQRFKRMQKEIHEQDPLVLYVFMQVVVATGAITSVICFGIGFVALACFPIFPKAPLTNSVRKLLMFGFGLLVAVTVFCFLFSAMILSYAVPMTSVCDTLTNVEEYNFEGPAVRFHETIGTNFNLTDSTGKEVSISFGRFLTTTGYESLASQQGNSYQDLFYPDNRGYLDQWVDFKNRSKPALNINRVSIPGQPELVKGLKAFSAHLEGIHLPQASQKTREITSEIRILKSILSHMDLPSLKSVVLPGCVWEFETMRNADRMQLASLFRSIQDYQKVMMSEFHYQTTKFNYLYRGGAAGDFCVELRTSFSIMCLILALLGALLVVNMIVIFNVADYLNKEMPELGGETPSQRNQLSSSDLRAPLLDEESEEK